jgi:hypothetical protein
MQKEKQNSARLPRPTYALEKKVLTRAKKNESFAGAQRTSSLLLNMARSSRRTNRAMPSPSYAQCTVQQK